jgi:hypothetical protein
MKSEASVKTTAPCEEERRASLKCTERFPDDKDEKCYEPYIAYRQCMDKSRGRSSVGLGALFR